MLGPPAGRPRDVDLPEAGAEVGDVGDRARVRQRVVGERRRRAHPQRIGVANLPVADARRGDLADLDEERRRAATRASTASGRAARRDRVEGRALFARVERRDHREDDLAVLHRADVPGRERTAVAVAIDVQDHRAVDAARAAGSSRAVECGSRSGGHRRARGAQRLRRDLAAVQRQPRARALLVLAAEEVAVEDLEIEQRREPSSAVAASGLPCTLAPVRSRAVSCGP